jgi:DNA-binding response OmpR family regulator
MDRARILVVEDDASLRNILRIWMQLDGHLVAEAANGGDAMRIIREEPPDLVLLDISMPVMNGLILLTELRDADVTPRPRVIVTTAHNSTHITVEAVRLGASDVLRKPLHLEDVRLSVASVLREPPPVRPAMAAG